MKNLKMLSAVTVVAALAGTSQAGTVSELNSVFDFVKAEVTAGAFPRNPAPGALSSINGTVELTSKALTAMSLFIDSVPQAPTATVSSIVASFDITNGDVSAGSFTVTLTDATSFTCAANPRALAGTDLVWSGGATGSYRVDGDVNNFLLSGALFGGVDVSVFFNTQPLVGSFFDFAFRPDTVAGGVGSVDEATQLGFVVATQLIPLPSGVGMASAGLLCLAGVRRRRLA